MSAQRIVVVGGGIAGLGTAALLADRGHDVQLFEARDALGGRAGSWESSGFRFDTGPSWYLMPEVFDHFFQLLGTSAAEQLDLVRLDPAYRVYGPPGKGEPIDIVSGREAVRALFEEHEPGSGDNIDAYLDSAKDAYELSTSKFLYDPYSSTKGLRDPALVKRLPTLIPLLTRTLWSRVTTDFKNTRLQQILAYPAVFLGGSPFEVPSLYHLMSHLDLGDGVLYPKGGMTEIIAAIEKLARDRGVRIETSTPVDAIITEAGVARGVRLADGRVISADAVVSGADLHHTETDLLEAKDRQYPEKWWKDKVPGPGALLLLLGVKGELPQLTHHTLLFTDDWHTNFDAIFGENKKIPDPASIYICRPSATDDSVAPAGHENLFVLVPVPADPDSGRGGVSGAGDERIEKAADRVIAQIAEWAGIPDLAERIVVRKTIAPEDFKEDLHAWHGNSLGLAHTLTQSAIFRPKNRSRKVKNLFYAGTSVLPGIGLPMCLISAELVVKRMTGDTSPAPSQNPHARRSEVPGIYLGAILFSLAGMMLIDVKYSLALRVAPWRTVATVLAGTAFFLAWDLVGIATGVFVKGESPLFVGVMLAPHLPLEEVFFLLFLSYLTVVMFAVFERRARARATARHAEVASADAARDPGDAGRAESEGRRA